MSFCTPLDFEGGPKIASVDIEADKIRKNGVLDRVLQQIICSWIFDAKIQGRDQLKNEFGM